MLLGNILWFPGWLAGVVYLNFAEDEIQFPVLLRLLTGVERAGLGEELHQLLLFSLTELPAFRLGVHPLRLATKRSDLHLYSVILVLVLGGGRCSISNTLD